MTTETVTVPALTFTYRNWRGEVGIRKIDHENAHFWFGSTEWHPEPQWLLSGIDLDKRTDRDFAVKDILHFGAAAPAISADGVSCAAVKQGTAGGNDPADCDWPFCGCDPHADKVIAALEESGHLSAPAIPADGVRDERRRRAAELMEPLADLTEDEWIRLGASMPAELREQLRAALSAPPLKEETGEPVALPRDISRFKKLSSAPDPTLGEEAETGAFAFISSHEMVAAFAYDDSINSSSCCHGCGLPYGDPAFPDLVVPHEVWRAISPTGDEGGLLCPSCMCRAASLKGIECGAVFRSGPFAAPDREDLVEAVAKTIHDHWQGVPGAQARPWFGKDGCIERLPMAAEDFRRKARAVLAVLASHIAAPPAPADLAKELEAGLPDISFGAIMRGSQAERDEEVKALEARLASQAKELEEAKARSRRQAYRYYAAASRAEAAEARLASTETALREAEERAQRAAEDERHRLLKIAEACEATPTRDRTASEHYAAGSLQFLKMQVAARAASREEKPNV